MSLVADCGFFGGGRDRFGYGAFEFEGGCGVGEVRWADQGDVGQGKADDRSGLASPRVDVGLKSRQLSLR